MNLQEMNKLGYKFRTLKDGSVKVSFDECFNIGDGEIDCIEFEKAVYPNMDKAITALNNQLILDASSDKISKILEISRDNLDINDPDSMDNYLFIHRLFRLELKNMAYYSI